MPNVIKQGIVVVRGLEVDYIVLDNVILVSPDYINRVVTADLSLKVLPVGRPKVVAG